MNRVDEAPWPSPAGLSRIMDEVLRSAPAAQTRPPLRYLRRKPGRGLVAVYGDARAAGSMYTVTVDEPALSGQPLPGDVAAPAALQWDRNAGHVRVAELGLAIQRFPHDEQLPELADVMDPSGHPALWLALASAASSRHPEDGALTLLSAQATPLRYKPGDRCVIRYRLQLETAAGLRRTFTVIGKLYRTVDQATAAAALMERLWQVESTRAWTAQPFGVVEPLPLVLVEDLGSDSSEPRTIEGLTMIRFEATQPSGALRRAARALAELHTSSLASGATTRRTGREEAAKAAKRAAAIARYVPSLADLTTEVSTALTCALQATPACELRPSHGSYKPSQLLFRSDAVFLVDFDQFSLAEPALDVGYFLAYLRPPGLWYRREGTRSWFTTAAATFLSAYLEAAAELGMRPAELTRIERRCHVYEAALLMKIAARRPNRMHSPRQGEVRALLEEVRACLACAGQADAGVGADGS